MKTLVLQSHNPTKLAGWLLRAQVTVQRWAAERQYAYTFLDDRLFDVLPDHLKANNVIHRVMATDLARLLVIEKQLSSAYDRVIWLDCDVVIAVPDVFDPVADCHDGYVLGRKPLPPTY